MLCVDPLCRGSILFQRRCATLCTSGFTGDLTFGRNGRDAERWRLTRAARAVNDVTIPGQSLMSMNACLLLLCIMINMYLITIIAGSPKLLL